MLQCMMYVHIYLHSLIKFTCAHCICIPCFWCILEVVTNGYTVSVRTCSAGAGEYNLSNYTYVNVSSVNFSAKGRPNKTECACTEYGWDQKIYSNLHSK